MPTPWPEHVRTLRLIDPRPATADGPPVAAPAAVAFDDDPPHPAVQLERLTAGAGQPIVVTVTCDADAVDVDHDAQEVHVAGRVVHAPTGRPVRWFDAGWRLQNLHHGLVDAPDGARYAEVDLYVERITTTPT